MKSIKKAAGVLILLATMMCHTAYANEMSWEAVSDHHTESILLAEDSIDSTDTINNIARGIRLSTAMLTISNEENGSLHISVNTLAHKSVDSIYQTVFLDEWNEEKESWVQIGKWDFERTKEEEEDGELTSYHVGFFVDNCVVNRYYRARAMHLVEWGDEAEAKVTQTNGVLLTDHAV